MRKKIQNLLTSNYHVEMKMDKKLIHKYKMHKYKVNKEAQNLHRGNYKNFLKNIKKRPEQR